MVAIRHSPNSLWTPDTRRKHSRELLAEIGEDVTPNLKGLWASRAEANGWAAIRRDAEFLLLEACEARYVNLPPAAFWLSRRAVERFRFYRIVNQRRNDRKAYDDSKPRITRQWSHLAPMDVIVADVKPLDIIVLRPDGSEAWPRAIGFYDAGTGARSSACRRRSLARVSSRSKPLTSMSPCMITSRPGCLRRTQRAGVAARLFRVVGAGRVGIQRCLRPLILVRRSMGELHFRYREEAFSAAEAAAITGLTLTMQRDWRSHGHLPPLRSARATFSPRELAEMRIMVRARARGVSLAESRKLATAAAPDLLHILVSDHAMVEVDGEEARGRRYLDAIDRQTDGEFLNWLSGVESGSGRRIVILYDDGSWKIIPSLEQDTFDVTAETPAILNLDASAKAIAQAVAPRKLFTLMAPGFE